MSMRTPLGRAIGLGSAKSGTEEFWMQRMTAIASVPLTIAGLVLMISLTGRSSPGGDLRSTPRRTPRSPRSA